MKRSKNPYKHFYYFKFNLFPFCMAFFFQEKLSKLEKIQERFLKNHFQKLHRKLRKVITEIERQHTLVTELFRTFHSLNPAIIKNIFNQFPTSHKKCNFQVPYRNTTKYEDKSIRSLGAHI